MSLVQGQAACRACKPRVAAASQYVFLRAGILRPEKHKMAILNNVSSVIRPGRTTLLLGPPAAGKSTLLKALAGKLSHEGGLKARLAPAMALFLPILLASSCPFSQSLYWLGAGLYSSMLMWSTCISLAYDRRGKSKAAPISRRSAVM